MQSTIKKEQLLTVATASVKFPHVDVDGESEGKVYVYIFQVAYVLRMGSVY